MIVPQEWNNVVIPHCFLSVLFTIDSLISSTNSALTQYIMLPSVCKVTILACSFLFLMKCLEGISYMENFSPAFLLFFFNNHSALQYLQAGHIRYWRDGTEKNSDIYHHLLLILLFSEKDYLYSLPLSVVFVVFIHFSWKKKKFKVKRKWSVLL